jgi:hypothetical protein
MSWTEVGLKLMVAAPFGETVLDGRTCRFRRVRDFVKLN